MSVVLRGVIQQQGVRGLWRGATPSVLRLIMLNGSMCGTYDEVRFETVWNLKGAGGAVGWVVWFGAAARVCGSLMGQHAVLCYSAVLSDCIN
jgi:hypothetical protein